MKKNVFVFWLLLSTILAVSCNNYQKILKTNDFVLMYKKSFEYYNKGDYMRASELFDRIASIYKGTEKGDSTAFFQAMSYFRQNDYLNASYHFDNFYKNFPYSPFSEEAMFMAGYCYYKRSPKAELDQQETLLAIEVLQEFIRKNPGSKFAEAAQGYVGSLHDRLIEKSYISAKLYYEMGDYKAAATSLAIALGEYPETKHREEILFLTLRSKYLFAEKSIEGKQRERYQDTVDEYMSFAAEFPESKHKTDAKKMYEVASKYVPADELNK